MSARTTASDDGVRSAPRAAGAAAGKGTGVPAPADPPAVRGEAGDVFDARERAAPAPAEAVAPLTGGFLPDAVHEGAVRRFGEAEPARPVAPVDGTDGGGRPMAARRIAAGSGAW